MNAALKRLFSCLTPAKSTVWLRLPEQSWFDGQRDSLGKELCNHKAFTDAIGLLSKQDRNIWPTDRTFFISDVHADEQAFVRSLLSTQAVILTANNKLALNESGLHAHFVIGGDSLFKGPSNLKLLNVLREFANTGARLTLLAGNHDINLLLALKSFQLPTDSMTEHFFIRVLDKLMPLFVEIDQQYPHQLAQAPSISASQCREKLLPGDTWQYEFRQLAANVLDGHLVEKEINKVSRKMKELDTLLASHNMTMTRLYSIVELTCKLFLEPYGEFAWFYRNMQLAHRDGAFLFVHAGLDDQIAAQLCDEGIDRLNEEFRDQINARLFDFYYGALINSLTTRYRAKDRPLTNNGVKQVNQAGIYAIVHGHRHKKAGQRIKLRSGLLHFESDITMDKNSRKGHALNGLGGGVTVVCPEHKVLGISSDFPYTKTLQV